MKFEIFQFVCVNGHAFSAPSLGEAAYGEFLLWSSNGDAAYLNAFEDPTYKAIDLALQAHPKTLGFKSAVRTRLLQRIYGPVACDPDGNGSPFRLDMKCPCPICGTQEMASWEAKEPAEMADIPLNGVTHRRWSALSEVEQIDELDKVLSAT